MSTLRFKSHLHVEIVLPENLFLLSEKGPAAFTGRLFVELAPLLDGRFTFPEIIENLKDTASFSQINYALTVLRNGGFLTDEDSDSMPPGISAFWSVLGVDFKTVTTRLAETVVSIKTMGAVDATPLVSILNELGIQTGDKGDISVVLTDDYLQDGLREFNQYAIDHQQRWLLAKPVGAYVWVGPWIVPGETACWDCMKARLEANREIDAFLLAHKKQTTPFPTSKAVFPPVWNMALNMIAAELAKAIVTEANPRLENTIMVYDSFKMELQPHKVVKRPQCETCGESLYRSQVHPPAIELQSSPKGSSIYGSHRVMSPDAMWAQYERQVSPITGVVAYFVSRLNVDGVVNIQGAIHNFTLRHDVWEEVRKGLRWRSGGKGTTATESRASALGESLERYSGIMQSYDYRIRSTYRDLGESAIHPNSYMQYSQRQYENRRALNARGFQQQLVPMPFDETQEIDWTPLWSLRDHCFKYLPTACCYYYYWGETPVNSRHSSNGKLPLDSERTIPIFEDPNFEWFARADSNGCASGSTYEEAILPGFMELVERDCIAMWWYNQLRRPAVDIESSRLPGVARLREYYRSIGREVWALDLTNDLGIPVFVALSKRTNNDSPQICIGFGAHFDPNVALSRALTEMAEMLSSVNVFNNSPAVRRDFDPAMSQWIESATVENQSYINPASEEKPRSIADFSYIPSTDLRDDVLKCQSIVQALGLDMLVLDQTRPDIGLKVMKVAVPGLRHFWERFAPGRLYDVPVQLGWIDKPVPEEALNKMPFFF